MKTRSPVVLWCVGAVLGVASVATFDAAWNLYGAPGRPGLDFDTWDRNVAAWRMKVRLLGWSLAACSAGCVGSGAALLLTASRRSAPASYA